MTHERDEETEAHVGDVTQVRPQAVPRELCFPTMSVLGIGLCVCAQATELPTGSLSMVKGVREKRGPFSKVLSRDEVGLQGYWVSLRGTPWGRRVMSGVCSGHWFLGIELTSSSACRHPGG